MTTSVAENDNVSAEEAQAQLLAAKEKEIRKKYRRVEEGSIRKETEGKFANKITVVIRCKHHGCDRTRRVATSDLHQVEMCEECTRTTKLSKRKKAAAEAKKTKPPKPPKPASKPASKPAKKPKKKDKSGPAEAGKRLNADNFDLSRLDDGHLLVVGPGTACLYDQGGTLLARWDDEPAKDSTDQYDVLYWRALAVVKENVSSDRITDFLAVAEQGCVGHLDLDKANALLN